MDFSRGGGEDSTWCRKYLGEGGGGSRCLRDEMKGSVDLRRIFVCQSGVGCRTVRHS